MKNSHGWDRPDPWMGEERKKERLGIRKIKEKNNMNFILQTEFKQTYDALLDVDSLAPTCGILPPEAMFQVL